MSNKEGFSYLKNCQNGSHTKPKKKLNGHKLRNQRRIHHYERSQQKWLFCPQLSQAEAESGEGDRKVLGHQKGYVDDNQFHG